MTIDEKDLIASLLRGQNYLEQITEELCPDDTLDLLNGTRKGKSTTVKDLDHIVGVSDLQTRQKAKEMRLKAVTQGKTKQLLKSLIAMGIYLRKSVLDHL